MFRPRGSRGILPVQGAQTSQNDELQQRLAQKRKDGERILAANTAETHRLGMLQRAIHLLDAEAGNYLH